MMLQFLISADDWENFKERFALPDEPENNKRFQRRMEETEDAMELRMWASYRGQTLARTVRGMMYYER